MGISCDCDGDYDWWFEPADDFSAMPRRTRRCRCASCKKLLDAGAVTLALKCTRQPRDYIEEEIYGGEVPLATKYLCERCGEILLNLLAAGLCVSIGGNLENDLREYWKKTGFDPAKYQKAVEVSHA